MLVSSLARVHRLNVHPLQLSSSTFAGVLLSYSQPTRQIFGPPLSPVPFNVAQRFASNALHGGVLESLIEGDSLTLYCVASGVTAKVFVRMSSGGNERARIRDTHCSLVMAVVEAALSSLPGAVCLPAHICILTTMLQVLSCERCRPHIFFPVRTPK
ncbi:hypothetical protein O3P69_008182 [Scylla paramamosain]|uniref:Uncharacterized protein n=1 Tax=Scylla paramamosain TaxID=85552 RepID=A0AAW0T1L6_SCYPA